MRTEIRGALLLLSLVGTASLADPPSPDTVKATWEFFYKGKGSGLVLADAKLCLEVSQKGEDKFECTKEVPAEGVKAGATVHVWQAYLVPQGDTVDDVTVQSKQGDLVRETKDVKVTGEGWRSRTWTTFHVGKAGTWSFIVNRGANALKTFTLTVT
jgi:hypothetical protein